MLIYIVKGGQVPPPRPAHLPPPLKNPLPPPPNFPIDTFTSFNAKPSGFGGPPAHHHVHHSAFGGGGGSGGGAHDANFGFHSPAAPAGDPSFQVKSTSFMIFLKI